MHKRFFSSLALGCVALLTALWVVACQPAGNGGSTSGGSSSSGGSSGSNVISGAGGVKDTLRLGALLPVTGDLSSIGAPMIKSIDFLVDTVNQCGGVLGKPITYIKEDDRTDPPAGAEAMTKLAKVDNVGAVVGSFASSVSA
ncbi:MAG: ABC transporter substrate-binding protein, partial [Pseudanabaenaceae cyanobacterium]